MAAFFMFWFSEVPAGSSGRVSAAATVFLSTWIKYLVLISSKEACGAARALIPFTGEDLSGVAGILQYKLKL